MKRLTALCLALFLLILSASAIAETVFRHRLNPKLDKGFAVFQAQHPELRFVLDETQYDDWGRMTSALITGQVESEVFALSTFSDDCGQIFAKGYCLDLSGSATLLSLVSRMHKSIQEQVMKEGRLFALPESLKFSYSLIDRRAWTEAGLTTVDIPQSFPALLDFLDAWCLRQEGGGATSIRVKSNWVPELYGPGSYTAWLTRLLLANHMLQQQHAGQALRFHQPELLALLARILKVGTRIYQVEPPFDPLASGEGLGLMNETGESSFSSRWPKRAEDLMFLPIVEHQPRLLAATLDMQVVNAKTRLPQLGTLLLECLAENSRPAKSVYLFADAVPLLNPNYEEDLALIQNKLAQTEEALKSSQLSLSQRHELEDQLRSFQQRREEIEAEERKYLMSAVQLAQFVPLAANFVFLKPGYFSFGKDHYFFSQTIDRFAAGQLSAEGLLQELDRVVIMMERELGGR